MQEYNVHLKWTILKNRILGIRFIYLFRRSRLYVKV